MRHSAAQINLGPFAGAQFAGAQEHQGDSFRAPRCKGARIGMDGAQQPAQLCRVGDGGIVLFLCVLECAARRSVVIPALPCPRLPRSGNTCPHIWPMRFCAVDHAPRFHLEPTANTSRGPMVVIGILPM